MAAISFSALEYRDAGSQQAPLRLVPPADPAEVESESVASSAGVRVDEVEQRVRAARETAIVETEQWLRAELEADRQRARAQLTETLRRFAEERANYFRRVEDEVVHLALAIARKILQREAELDPTLLAALVRIALDRMDCGPSVRLRVVPGEVEHWLELGQNGNGALRWEVAGDDALQPGDCIVETGLGKANFAFEAQLRDVEETFMQLIAHKPSDV
jgi:flagellar assembly protein FliH